MDASNLWLKITMQKKKLPTTTNLQNMCCLSSNSTPWLCSKVKTDSSQSTANSTCSSRNTAGEENVLCASVNGNFDVEVISMCVVPTKISHQNCKETIRTYAMLDSCSQGRSFLRYLSPLKGKEAFVSTCHGRMLICKTLLIMKFVYVRLVGHHPLNIVTMLYEEQLWMMFYVTVKKQIIPF